MNRGRPVRTKKIKTQEGLPMGLGKVVGGVAKLGIAALAVAGVCSLFKEEIRETEAYKKANEKYDVDTKVQKATAKVKSTTLDAAKKVSETAKTVKEKASEKWSAADDTAVAEDEIILDGEAPADREYVSLSAATEAVADAVNAAAETSDSTITAAADTAENVAEAASDSVSEAAAKADDIILD